MSLLSAAGGVLGQQGAGGGGGGFNVETDINWLSLHYTGSAAFQALGYVEGNNVLSMPDVTGNCDLSMVTNPFAYTEAEARLNYQPAFQTGALSSRLRPSGGMTTAPTVPYSVVVIGASNESDSNARFTYGVAAANNPRASFLTSSTSNGEMRFRNGTLQPYVPDGMNDTDAVGAGHIHIGYFSGDANGWHSVDNYSSVVDTSLWQTGDEDGISFGSPPGSNGSTHLATYVFGAVVNGDLSAHAKYADFLAWVTATYGITMTV